MRIYVAGPIGSAENKAQRKANIQQGILAGIALARAGFSPFVPHLMCTFEGYLGAASLGYEDYMRIDFDFLESCHAMLRLPGDSPGADREEVWADQHSIPVFHSVDAVIDSCRPR